MTVFWILKKTKATPKITVQRTTIADELGDELAEAVTPRSCKMPVTPCRRRLVVCAVPPGAVLAVGEHADAEDAEEAADAVHRDGADGVVDTSLSRRSRRPR